MGTASAKAKLLKASKECVDKDRKERRKMRDSPSLREPDKGELVEAFGGSKMFMKWQALATLRLGPPLFRLPYLGCNAFTRNWDTAHETNRVVSDTLNRGVEYAIEPSSFVWLGASARRRTAGVTTKGNYSNFAKNIKEAVQMSDLGMKFNIMRSANRQGRLATLTASVQMDFDNDLDVDSRLRQLFISRCEERGVAPHRTGPCRVPA